jgi:thiol-disulfide isomerase/thioredoxin
VAVTELTTKEEFWEAVKQPHTVIDIARRNGCVPCARLEPHFQKAAETLPGIKFYQMHLDEVEGETLDYMLDGLGILSTPTVLEYKYGGLQKYINARTAPLLIRELT